MSDVITDMMHELELERKQLTIQFGALAPKIEDQLTTQGFEFDEKKVKHFELLKECITHLYFSSLLSDNEFSRVIDKLFTKIKQHVASKNDMKSGKTLVNGK